MKKIVLIVIIAALVVGGGTAAAVILLTRGGPSLTIASVELCSDVTEEGDYTVQPGATFERGDTVWLYFEASGVTSRGTDGQFEVWVKFSDMKLYDPDGNMLAHVIDVGELHDTFDEAATYAWFSAYFDTIAGDPLGQYRWEFTVRDELSGATGTGSATFTLEEPSHPVISIGSELYDMAADPARPYLYVSDTANNAILVISTQTNAVEKSIVVGASPTEIDISQDNSTLYVALSGATSIAVVDLDTQTKTGTISVPSIPNSVCTGRTGRLYVGVGQETKIIDTATKTEVGSCSGGGILAISSDRDTLYTQDLGFSYPNVYKWDVTTDSPVLLGSEHLLGGGCSMDSAGQMYLSPDGLRAYCIGGSINYDGWLPALSTVDFSLLGRFRLDWTPIAVVVSPEGTKVYACHSRSVTNPTNIEAKHDRDRKDIHVFDAETFLEENVIEVRDFVSERGLEISPDGSKLFAIIGSGANQDIEVIDLTSP